MVVNMENILYDFLDKRYEGAYWDFKQEYHDNKAKLLHDIICMANNLIDRDAYIIFGVNDQGEVFGVEDDPNRKNQENFITFLRDKKFIGGYRPELELKVVQLGLHEVDVLIIKRNSRTPFYLSEDFVDKGEKIRGNYIYTRVMDTNTPRDKSADEVNVEWLWKKRFGLVPLPLERLRIYLGYKVRWMKRGETHYYEENPEFTVNRYDDKDNERISRRENLEFYCYYQTNNSSYYEMINCKYFSTILYSCQIVILDSGRYITTTPTWDHIDLDQYHQQHLTYRYYIKETMDYKMHLYLFDETSDEACTARRKFMEIVLLFESDIEKEQFKEYIQGILSSFRDELERKKNKNLVFDCDEESVRVIENERIHTGLLLNEELKKFRKINHLTLNSIYWNQGL